MDWGSVLPGIVSSSIAALVAAAGWFIAASRNYHYQNKLQIEREAREAEGIRRLVIADVRVIAIRLQPWVTSYAELRLNELINAYESLAKDLKDKDVAASLTAEQYDVMFDLLDRFGRDVAYEQTLFGQLPELDESGKRKWTGEAATDWRHQTIATFESTIFVLLSAGEALGDDVISDKAKGLMHLLDTGRGLNPYLAAKLEF